MGQTTSLHIASREVIKMCVVLSSCRDTWINNVHVVIVFQNSKSLERIFVLCMSIGLWFFSSYNVEFKKCGSHLGDFSLEKGLQIIFCVLGLLELWSVAKAKNCTVGFVGSMFIGGDSDEKILTSGKLVGALFGSFGCSVKILGRRLSLRGHSYMVFVLCFW